MDSKRFKKKYFLGVLGSNITLLPFATGAICSMGYLVFENTPLALVGVFGILAGVGTFVYRFLVSPSEKIARKAQEEIEREDNEVKEADNKAREAALDELEKQLRRTKGSADEEALKDLRALVKAFKTEFNWANSSTSSAASHLLSIVDDNFGQCVITLQASLKLYNTITNSKLGRDTQASLVKKRDEMIKRVQDILNNLNAVFAQMYDLSVSNDPSSKLSENSDKLTRQLVLLKKIDERTRALDKRIGLGNLDEGCGDDWLKDLES